jgi:hypothetical protein
VTNFVFNSSDAILTLTMDDNKGFVTVGLGETNKTFTPTPEQFLRSLDGNEIFLQ